MLESGSVRGSGRGTLGGGRRRSTRWSPGGGRGATGGGVGWAVRRQPRAGGPPSFPWLL